MKEYSAILEMDNGRRGDGQCIQPNEEYQAQANKYVEVAEQLEERLKKDEKGLELLKELFSISAGMENAAAEQHYREGFAFGMLIGLEVADTR